MKNLSKFKVLFILMGAAQMALGAYWAMATFNFLETANLADGEVVSLVESWSGETRVYAPVILFQSGDSGLIKFTSSTSSYPSAYDVGDHVEVLFLPTSPHDAKVNGFFTLWGGSVILGFMGGVFLLIGSGAVFYEIFQRREAIDA